jgi:hypothetical protein
MPQSRPRSVNWSSVYFPKREALGLKRVRALPKDSMTNSAAGTWEASLEPFFPGLLTLSSSRVLMARRRFSDFPLPDSPLEKEHGSGGCVWGAVWPT